jgi:hypoxia up-regulated 1
MAATVAAILVMLLAAGSQPAHAAIFALDLGSEFLKVSLVKPGRTPIAVVTNEMSKRKTPALVGFAPAAGDGKGFDRLQGEEASSFAVRYPTTTIARARDLLAKPADDPSIVRMMADNSLPFKVVQHPVTQLAGVQLSPDTVLTAEEVVVRAVMRPVHAGRETCVVGHMRAQGCAWSCLFEIVCLGICAACVMQ